MICVCHFLIKEKRNPNYSTLYQAAEQSLRNERFPLLTHWGPLFSHVPAAPPAPHDFQTPSPPRKIRLRERLIWGPNPIATFVPMLVDWKETEAIGGEGKKLKVSSNSVRWKELTARLSCCRLVLHRLDNKERQRGYLLSSGRKSQPPVQGDGLGGSCSS